MSLRQNFLSPLFNGFFFILLLWLVGFVLYTEDVLSMPSGVIDPALKSDGIVVLTGGTERVPMGLELLQGNYAPRLLISGVDPRANPTALIQNHAARTKMECCITLGVFAEDTHGNAKEAAGWVQKFGMKTIIMVTANYHMRRALLEFHQALPHTIVYHVSVNPAIAHIDEWWMHPGTAGMLMEEYNKYLLATIKAAVHSVMAAE